MGSYSYLYVAVLILVDVGRALWGYGEPLLSSQEARALRPVNVNCMIGGDIIFIEAISGADCAVGRLCREGALLNEAVRE